MSFRPFPLLGNPHVQTILGAFVDRARATLPAMRHAVALPDGDRVVIHETFLRRRAARQPASIALLVHGLCGSHRSGYMRRITARLADRGWRVFRMDLRGAGAGIRLARRVYSASCSDDVRAVVAHLAQSHPGASIAVAGFSLGGNIVLKFAAEAGEAPLPSLRAICAVAPPIDLCRCSAQIAGYPWYDSFFVRQLTAQAERHQSYFPELPRVRFPARLTLRQFDDLYTAPRWGYADALDYYRQASAVSRMAQIRVPTFVLAARDDPLIAVAPLEELQARADGPIDVHIAAHGGHLGFIGLDETGGIRWAETQIVHWLMKNFVE